MPPHSAKPVRKRQKATKSFSRLTPFLRGVIYGMFLAGSSVPEIMEEVVKPDGFPVSKTSVETAIQRAEETGGMHSDGDFGAAAHSGRPRSTTTALDKALVELVFKHRGRAKVTVAFARKALRVARKVSARTVQRRLEEDGLTANIITHMITLCCLWGFNRFLRQEPCYLGAPYVRVWSAKVLSINCGKHNRARARRVRVWSAGP